MILTNDEKIIVLKERIRLINMDQDAIQYILDNPETIDFPDGDSWTQEVSDGIMTLLNDVKLKKQALEAEMILLKTSN